MVEKKDIKINKETGAITIRGEELNAGWYIFQLYGVSCTADFFRGTYGFDSDKAWELAERVHDIMGDYNVTEDLAIDEVLGYEV